jgi:hypothetical protein
MVDAVRLYGGPEASNSSLPALGAADHTECSQSDVDSTPPTNSTNTSTESTSDAWSTVACSEECLGPGPWIRKLPPRVQPFTSGQYNICPTTPNQQQCKILICSSRARRVHAMTSMTAPAKSPDQGGVSKAAIGVATPKAPVQAGGRGWHRSHHGSVWRAPCKIPRDWHSQGQCLDVVYDLSFDWWQGGVLDFQQ